MRTPTRRRGRPRKRKAIREKWPRVYRVVNHGRERFLVDARRSDFSGSKPRTFHETEAEALATAEQLERVRHNEGARAFVDLSAKQRGDAGEALAILAEYDADLVTAARHYVAALEAERKRAVGPTVKEALDAFLKSKRAETERGELSKLTFWDLASKANPIRDYFGEKRVTEIDYVMVGDFLAQLDIRPRGKSNVRLKLSQFLNWCMRQNWIATNAASDVKVKVPQSEVKTLTVEEAETLLRSAERSEHAESVLPYLAVSLFAGLRPNEAAQLRWEQIDFGAKQIKVLAQTSKVRESRYIEIGSTLAAWLKPYREKHGLIVGDAFKKNLGEVKRRAGFGSGENGTKKWPVDVLRHSFGSFWLPIHKNRAALAEQMGNSVEIIKRNYRKAEQPHVARQFWAIRPKAKGPKPTKPVSETIIEFPTQPAETTKRASG